MIYRIFCLLLLFLCTSLTLYAQSRQASAFIKGTVTDSISASPVIQATISLYRDSEKLVFRQLLTDEKGAFLAGGLPQGIYRLSITSIGYSAKQITGLKIMGSIAPEINLGTIRLLPVMNNLQGVTINAAKPVIEQKIDRLIYNAANDQTATTGDATDVLRKVPMVSVDGDGNVALRGNKNVRILIDGKVTGTGSTGDILQSLPAGQVKSIEVMTSASAKFDGEGSGGIVNIITRKKTVDGTNGTLYATMGTRQYSGNGSITAKTGKLTFSGNAGISNKWPRDIGINAYTYNTKGDSSFSKGNSNNSRISNNASLILQYDINPQNSLSSTFRRTAWGYNDDMQVQSVSKVFNAANLYNQSTIGKVRSSGFDWSTDYLKRFATKGEELDIAAQWSNNSSLQYYRSIYSGYFNSQQVNNQGDNNEYTLQLNYTRPMNPNLRLETGAKGVYRHIISSSDYFSIDPMLNDHYDAQLSNVYRYTQQVYAAYAVLHFTMKKGWEFQVGNRLEMTAISGRSESASSELQPFSNDYFSYIPALTLMKKLDGNGSVKLSYTKRIQRPSLQFLNPFRNTSDPLNQTEGNPLLSPEHEQTLELAYATSSNSASFSGGLYYKQTGKLIEGFAKDVTYTTYDLNGTASTKVITLTRYGNIGTNRSLGADIFGSLNFSKAWSIRGNFDLYTYHPQIDRGYDIYLNAGTFFLYNGFVGTTYKISATTTLEANYSFQSRWRTFQGTNANLNIMNIGAKKEILKGRASVGLVAVNLFQNKWNFGNRINTPELVQYRNLSTPFRSFNLNLNYKFGASNLKPLRQRGVKNDDLK